MYVEAKNISSIDYASRVKFKVKLSWNFGYAQFCYYVQMLSLLQVIFEIGFELLTTYLM